jgi:hypothetical protein
MVSDAVLECIKCDRWLRGRNSILVADVVGSSRANPLALGLVFCILGTHCSSVNEAGHPVVNIVKAG